MILGFTGTRETPTIGQLDLLEKLLEFFQMEHGRLTLHHGACKGSDAGAALLFMNIGGTIVAHPGDTPGMIMEKMEGKFRSVAGKLVHAFWQNQKPNLVRNRIIVDRSELLIVCPKEQETNPRIHPRSGTWYTCRYAQMLKKPYIIILPNGTFHLGVNAIPYVRTFARKQASGRI